jgi:hypothetical protein
MASTREVRNQIGPLLDRLIVQLDNEGSATQRAYFARIRRSLYGARHSWDLATPMRELSTTSAVGFKFSNDADALITRILEKAAALADELADSGSPRPPSGARH